MRGGAGEDRNMSRTRSRRRTGIHTYAQMRTNTKQTRPQTRTTHTNKSNTDVCVLLVRVMTRRSSSAHLKLDDDVLRKGEKKGSHGMKTKVERRECDPKRCCSHPERSFLSTCTVLGSVKSAEDSPPVRVSHPGTTGMKKLQF